ncbi:hypothetical protein PV326_013609 [Microctonus aethiopoides]|nr:hypothetical protein PV326_013609 [Microctonus aethiopoides]
MVGIVFVGITPQRFYMADCSLPQIMVSVVAGAIWTLVLYENGLILICVVGLISPKLGQMGEIKLMATNFHEFRQGNNNIFKGLGLYIISTASVAQWYTSKELRGAEREETKHRGW